jgi:hypothetical protein
MKNKSGSLTRRHLPNLVKISNAEDRHDESTILSPPVSNIKT